MDSISRPQVGFIERAKALSFPGITLKDYQVNGIARLLAGVAPIHAWAIGSGKTWLALGSFMLLRQDQPSIRMVATMPKSILSQWRATAESVGFRVFVLRSAREVIPAGIDVLLVPATATLVNARQAIRDWLGAGFLCLDEAHLFKSATAKRTQAVYGPRLDRVGGLAERPKRVLAMSGTFAPNHNGELYPHLRALAPDTIPNGNGNINGGALTLGAFEARYCLLKAFGPSRIKRPVGSANTQELRDMFLPRVTIVTSAQVQAAFPHPRSERVLLDPQDVDFDFLAAAALIPDPELRERAIEVHQRILAAASPDVVDALVVELLQLAGQDRHLAHLRRAIGRAKIAYLEDLVDGRAPDDAPTLVFNTYVETGNEAMRRLAEKNISAVRIYGATPQGQRDAAIVAVKESRTTVALLQVEAAGAGLNLQAADTVVMLEPSWSPGVNEQAIGRACRLGQTRSVRILWPVIRGTIDEAVLRVLKRKSKNAQVLWS